MNRLIAFLLCCISLAILNVQAGFVERTHESAALSKTATFYAYVPEDAQPGERFPTLYVLHGAYGSYKDWVEKSPLPELSRNYRMIVICPDGGEFGWYVDSPVKANHRYQTYITKELVGHVDAEFPTVAKREGRGIMGLSMGGHGALLLTARHPDVFGSASALSGILKLTDHPDRWHIVDALGAFDKNRTAWEGNSVWEQAESLKNSGARVMFDCGVDDKATSAIFDCQKLHERLTELKAPHIWRELPGTHSWKYWSENLESHLNFHQAAMIDSTPGMVKWQRHYFERMRAFADENLQLSMTPASEAKSSVCLLGSSSMEGFPEELLKGFRVFNRGITADTLGIGPRGVSRRMELSVFDMRPNLVIINNGTNDLGDRARSEDGKPTIDEMEAEFAEIVARIKARLPQTSIIITSCTPVGGRYAHLTDGLLEYNARLRELAKRERVMFIDLFTPLADENNHLKADWTSDGLHFKRPGYEIWAAEIGNVLKQ